MYNQFYPYMMPNASIIPNTARMATPALGAVTKTNPLSALFGARSAAPAASALGAATKTSTFTFSGFLNGASKTLGVINQAIPVFYQVKPIINNAKTMYRVAKEINSSSTVKNTSNVKTNSEKNVTTNNRTNTTNDNQPNFFI